MGSFALSLVVLLHFLPSTLGCAFGWLLSLFRFLLGLLGGLSCFPLVFALSMSTLLILLLLCLRMFVYIFFGLLFVFEGHGTLGCLIFGFFLFDIVEASLFF